MGLAGRGLPTGCPPSSQVPQVLCKPPAAVPDRRRGAAPLGRGFSLSAFACPVPPAPSTYKSKSVPAGKGISQHVATESSSQANKSGFELRGKRLFASGMIY